MLGKFRSIIVVVGGLAFSGTKLAAAQAPGAQTPTVTAFVHVNVIAMEDTNQVLRDQTVVVRGGRITALGPAATVVVPAGAARIDGRDKYLIPGLADMHAHVGLAGKPAERAVRAQDHLFRYAANGVTTIRNVNYMAPETLMVRMRGLAAAGKLWSPRIYTASDWRQYPERSVAQNLVAYQAAGYDFIKLHGETGALLDSIATAAHLLGIPLMGHVEDSVPHALAVHYGSIEHLTGYPGAGISPSDTHNLADTTRLPELIAATQRAGIWNCPTQALYELWDTDPETWLERQYGPSIGRTLQDADSATVLWWKLRRRIIKTLQDAGAGLLLGTDAPLMAYGFGVHRELQALVRAGLTPYQALASGTRNVAAYFGNLRTEGTVAVGKRADLVLLTGNPLDDITHTMNPAGVMVNGRWLSRAAIDRGLAAAAAAFAARTRKAKAAERKQRAAP